MFNPFVLLTPELLHAFVDAGKKYFVRQSFERAKDHFRQDLKVSFIFTHYAEIGQAQHHYGALPHDPYRFLYQWENPEDRLKLEKAAIQPQGYSVYAALFKTAWLKHVTPRMKEKAKAYLQKHLN